VKSEDAIPDEESEAGLEGRAGGREFRRKSEHGDEGKAGGFDSRRELGIGFDSKTGRLTAGASWRLARRSSRKVQMADEELEVGPKVKLEEAVFGASRKLI
jgi:hypothetical protein